MKRTIPPESVRTLLTLGAAVLATAVFAQERPNDTATFLGGEATWSEAMIIARQASPLFGGREYYMWGDGRLIIVDIRRSREAPNDIVERRYVLSGVRSEATRIFQKFRDTDLLNVPLEMTDRPTPTCTDPPLVILRNAAGEVRTLPLVRGSPTPAFEDVLHDVATLIRLTRGRLPDHQGPYDSGFMPQGVEWAAAALRAARQMPWAPAVTPEENERLEREWREKVRFQLEAIEKAKVQQRERDGRR